MQNTLEKHLILFFSILLGFFFAQYSLIFALTASAFIFGMLEITSRSILIMQTTTVYLENMRQRVFVKLLLPLSFYLLFWIKIKLVQAGFSAFKYVPIAHILATHVLMSEIMLCFKNILKIFHAQKVHKSFWH